MDLVIVFLLSAVGIIVIGAAIEGYREHKAYKNSIRVKLKEIERMSS